MKPATVAVCIPTFNQASYLRETVESVLRQTRPVAEIVISDDASTDDTAVVCAELMKTVPHLRTFLQAANRGIAGNTDFALRQATSDFLVRVDSDDRLLPDYVARLAACLEQEPTAGYAHGAVWEINHLGHRRHLRRLFRPAGFQAADEALRAAVSGYRVAANILMFRRAALEAVNFTAGRPDYVEDYHLSVALARAGWGNCYCDEPLAEYRVWMDVKRTRAGRKLLELAGCRRTFDEQLGPGFSERRWPTRAVVAARQKLAVRHSVVLIEEPYSPTEQAEVIAGLVGLGGGWRLSWRLALIRAGLGKIILSYSRISGNVRASLKTILLALRQWNTHPKRK